MVQKVTGALSAAAMLAMAFLVGWQVFTRYFTANASVLTEEAIRLMLVGLTFMGGAYCFATEQHIAIDLFEGRSGTRWRRALRYCFSLIYSSLLAGGMGILAWQQRGQRLAALQLSMFWVYGSAAVAAVLMVLILLGKLAGGGVK